MSHDTNTKKLSGKVAIITGAARNLGRAIALGLAEDGADLVLHHHGERSRGDAAEVAARAAELGARVHVVAADLGARAEITRLFAEAGERFGRVDILVNNAGMIVKKPIVEITEQEYDALFAVNARAAFFAMQEAARHLADGGRVVNIGTTLLAATTAFYGAYAGSKAPLEDFSRALAREIGARRVTVNVIAPGPIDTPFYHAQESAQAVAYVKSAVPAGRLGEASDIVPVVRFLVSEEAGWINGQTIFVNGGYVAR